MRYKVLFPILIFIFLLISIIETQETINPDVPINKGSNFEVYKMPDNLYKKTIYFGEKYVLINGEYVLPNVTITSSNISGYSNEMKTLKYKVYFKSNTNLDSAVRFEKDGYFLAYDLSSGRMQWREQPGFPARTDTLGSGAPSNSQNCLISIKNDEASYSSAFFNTTVKYTIEKNMLKENFILYGLPSYKDYTYLEYTGNIKFNRTLKICANNQCYIPSGTQDNFQTSGEIEFKDNNNKTIFYITEPIITDSNNNSIKGLYDVKGSDAQMIFSLRINKTWLQTATYPIYIDPSITYNYSATYENINMWAYASDLSGCTNPPPPSDGPITTCGDLTDVTTDSALDESDDSDYRILSGSGEYNLLILQGLITNISISNIASINWTIEGHVLSSGDIGKIYSWNSTSSSWFNCASDITTTSDVIRNCATSLINNFVNSSNYTHLVIQDYAAGDDTYIDYVTLEITYDNTVPNITIDSPVNYFNTSNSHLTINYTVQDNDLKTCWWTNNTGKTNHTITCNVNITNGNWSEGSNTIVVYVNDSINQNSSSVIFTVDTITPLISIKNPSLNNSNYSYNTLDVNYTVSDTNLQSCWYSNDTFTVNTTLTSCANLTSVVWSEGYHNITIWSNDTANNLNQTSVAFQIDLTSPVMYITSPSANNSNYSYNTLDINYSVTDSNLQSCWYSKDAYTFNTSLINCSNITSVIWSDTFHNLTIWVNDSANNINKTSISFGIDTLAPSINIVSPVDYQSTTGTSIDLNYTIIDSGVGLSICKYQNNTDNNVTITCGTNISIKQAGDGNYIVTLCANDTLGNLACSTKHWIISLTAPTVNLVYPEIAQWFNNKTDIPFSFIATDSDNIDTCKLWSNWTGNWLLNQTLTSVVSSALTNFSRKNLTEGFYRWNVFCNDTTDTSSWAGNNRTFGIDETLPLVHNIDVNIVTESQTISFSFNATDTNLANCWYSIYNSSEGIDIATSENTSLTCNSAGNSETMSAYGNYTIRIWSNDSANNLNHADENFTLASSGGVIIIETGGGPSEIINNTIIIGPNATWQMYTESMSNNYDFFIGKGDKVVRKIFFKNLGVNAIDIDLDCVNISEGACDYVSLDKYNVKIEPNQNIETSIIMTMIRPETSEDKIYDFNIRGINKPDGSEGKISVRARGSYGIFSWIINKLGGKTNFDLSFISDKWKEIGIYNFFLLLIPFLFLSPLMYFFIFGLLKKESKAYKYKLPLTFLITTVISVSLMFFLN